MKVTLLSTFFILTFTSASLSQEKIQKLSDSLIVHYTLNEKKQLDGLYAIKDRAGETLMRGIYTNGNRSGNWFAFNKDESIFIRYNYDSKQLLQLDTNLIKVAEIKVLASDNDIARNARISFPVFPLELYIDFIREKAKSKIPVHHRNPQIPVLAEITAEIGEEGDTKYHLKYIYDDKTYNTQFKYSEKLIDFGWVPARYRDQTLPSQFKVFARFEFAQAPNHKRVIWN